MRLISCYVVCCDVNATYLLAVLLSVPCFMRNLLSEEISATEINATDASIA
jgi:hypothetical protein